MKIRNASLGDLFHKISLLYYRYGFEILFISDKRETYQWMLLIVSLKFPNEIKVSRLRLTPIKIKQQFGKLTDARCDLGTTLLVSSIATITRNSDDPVLARTLSSDLIACFAGRADGMTVAS